MATTPKKPKPPRENFLTRLPDTLTLDNLETLRAEGGYDTRNDAVVDSLVRNFKRVVKK